VRVTAVVVSWNAAGQLRACLDALDAQDHPDLEVLVVDNASADGTAEVLTTALESPRRHPLRVRWNTTNRGFAGAVNDALTETDADAVLVANVDVVAAPDLVRRLVAVLEDDPGCGSVQPRLERMATDERGRTVLDTTGHLATRARLFRNRGEGEVAAGRHGRRGEVFGVSGALALHRRAMLDDVAWRRADGGREWLTEDLFAYFDDVELDWRARLLGWRAVYEPAAVGAHERGGAGPRRTATVEALNFANRLLVVATCDDRRALLRAAPLVTVTTLLKLVELTVTTPRALLPALRRLGGPGGLPAARARRGQLLARARVSPAEVVARWFEPFDARRWVATWWRRVRGRAPGVGPG
jgi:GT2 family glycosyltransferase